MVKFCLSGTFPGTHGPHLHTRVALKQGLGPWVCPTPDLSLLGLETTQGHGPEVMTGPFSLPFDLLILVIC